MQLIDVQRFVDHYPLHLDLWLKDRYEQPFTEGIDKRAKWDPEKLMRGVQQCENKVEFVRNVELRLLGMKWAGDRATAADDDWAQLRRVVKEEATKLFTKEKTSQQRR